MIEIGKIIRSRWDTNRDSDTKTQLFQTQLLEKKDSQTLEEMHIPGVQYVPPVNSNSFYSRISEAFKIVLGIDDKVPKLETLNEGERIAYASASGAIVCSIWYKNDGTIAIVTDKDLTANVGGKATITAATEIELTAALIKLTGPVECSSTLDAVGNISTEADLSADGDVIADALALAISLINHFHQGNLGFPTLAAIMTGGGTTPSSLPTADASGEITDGLGTKSTQHIHSQGNDSNGDSEVDTGNAQ